jgi:hypothetical protein
MQLPKDLTRRTAPLGTLLLRGLLRLTLPTPGSLRPLGAALRTPPGMVAPDSTDYFETKDNATIPIFFATNREKEKSGNRYVDYRDQKRMHFGRRVAEINKNASDFDWWLILSEQIGLLARMIPPLGNFVNKRSPVKMHVREEFGGTESHAQQRMFREIEALADKIGHGEAAKIALLVPGMNQSLSDGEWRTAIQSFTVRPNPNYPGKLGYIGLCYSWPSIGRGEPSYSVDGCSAEESFMDFQRFLTDLVARFGAKNIVIITHSMGDRVVDRALRGWVSPNGEDDRFFARIDVAPDFDAWSFETGYIDDAVNSTESGHSWILGSQRDRLLLLSEQVHGTVGRAWNQFLRWIKGVKLSEEELRHEERPRKGQVNKLPRRWWQIFRIRGVDYTSQDDPLWGHVIPYALNKLILLLMEQGREDELPRVGDSQLVDDPEFIPVVVIKQFMELFGSISKMLDNWCEEPKVK